MQSTASAASKLLRLGTRGSPLARAQAEFVRDRLAAVHDVPRSDIPIEIISTSGDRLKDVPLTEAGGKGLFTKEIEQALLDGAIDVGVHSAKDVATVLPAGLELAVFLEREDVRDAFVSLNALELDDLPAAARFGTSSIRRAAQMLRHRPDLVIVPFRGNVDTRLQKLADGVADATLLAMAGLNRLGRFDEAKTTLDPRLFPPAPAQGAVTLEIRAGDRRSAALIAALDHPVTHVAVRAERAMLTVLDGSCRTPIGAFTTVEGSRIELHGQILSLDGTESYEATLSGDVEDAEALGRRVGETLREQAGPAFARLFGGQV